MKAQIFSHEKLIGTTELQTGDESMGCIYGDFIPTEDYYRYVQKTVWGFNTVPDYNKWHALKLNAQLDNGCFIFALGGFTFEDLKELPQEPIQINIAGVDRYIIEDFFLQEFPRPFVVYPWGSISIGQKLAFEEELAKELGNKNVGKSFLGIFNSDRDKHILSDFETMALCTDERNDDVLFRVRKTHFNKEFAIVHLTWRKDKESKGYPIVEFYENYDDFKYSRMYPDKADYEY